MNDTPTPAYGEPWTPLQPDLICDSSAYWMADAFNPSIRDRMITCVNSCAGMADPAAEIAALRRDLGQARGERDRQKVKITAMREAIREAHNAIKASPYPDQQAIAKLQPFTTP